LYYRSNVFVLQFVIHVDQTWMLFVIFSPFFGHFQTEQQTDKRLCRI